MQWNITFCHTCTSKNRANDGIAFVDVVLYILLKSRNCWEHLVKRGTSHIFLLRIALKYDFNEQNVTFGDPYSDILPYCNASEIPVYYFKQVTQLCSFSWPPFVYISLLELELAFINFLYVFFCSPSINELLLVCTFYTFLSVVIFVDNAVFCYSTS